MEVIKVTADNYGITITLQPSRKYIVGWWQIERDGFTHWLNHLSEKRWFTEDISRRFADICREHYNWN